MSSKTHLNITYHKTRLLKYSLLLRQDVYLSTPSIHGLPSVLTYSKCPLFLLFLFRLLCPSYIPEIPMQSSEHTKNSNTYNKSTCIMDVALKLLSVVSQGLSSMSRNLLDQACSRCIITRLVKVRFICSFTSWDNLQCKVKYFQKFERIMTRKLCATLDFEVLIVHRL